MNCDKLGHMRPNHRAIAQGENMARVTKVSVFVSSLGDTNVWVWRGRYPHPRMYKNPHRKTLTALSGALFDMHARFMPIFGTVGWSARVN